MKRASFTLFQPQRWMSKLGQSTLMVLFVWCCLSVSNVNAQAVVISDNGKTTHTTGSKTLTTCNGSVTGGSQQFTDDGANDGNYGDSPSERLDTMEFCPVDQWSHVKVVFNKFDLAPGDTLRAFDGTRKEIDGIGAITATEFDSDPDSVGIQGATGTGVSRAFGGWVDTNCDPADNPSGCITFVLQTNADNIKGAGWDAWVDCASRGINLAKPNISGAKLTCTDSAYAIITIPAPGFSGGGPTCSNVGDSVTVVVSNQKGDECINTTLSAGMQNGLPSALVDTFAIGIYSIKYTLKSDNAKTTAASFSVQAPALVCNDDVIIPLGSACMIQLAPDDILENPCPETRFMHYNITIKLGDDPKNWRKTNVDQVGHPIITPELIAAAGMSVCGGMATVEIERIYYDADDDGNGTDNAAEFVGLLESDREPCNNGPQNASCETNVRFEDQSAPFISITTSADTLIACDASGIADVLTYKGIDNCDDEVSVTYTVALNEDDPCRKNDGDSKPDTTNIVTVTFTAVDACGNVGSNSKDFVLIRPNENDHLVTYANERRDCKDLSNGTNVPGMATGLWKNNTFYVKDTVDLSVDDYICGYILTHRDVEIPATDCGRKIYRYWNIIDWCTPEIGPSAIDTTFIEYTDREAPTFVDETETYTRVIGPGSRKRTFGAYAPRNADLGPFVCTYDITKDETPVADDNCDDNTNVYINRIFRIENGVDWPSSAINPAALDCDSFRVEYIADDQCHEQLVNDTTYQIVIVRDVTKPSAVCTDELNVSVPSDGGARIRWEDIDGGSVDACGIKTIEIRRKGSDDAWGEYVDVVCEDVHVGLQIEMRVTDNKGNENICWMDVTAEDKIPPVCTDLPPMTFTCDEFHNGEFGVDTDGEFVALTGDLMEMYNARFGNPTCSDNLTCGILEITQEYRLTELTCGELTIERRYSASDWRPNTSNVATQLITVNYVPNWKLTFPADVDLTCGDDFPDAATAADIITNGSCDLWALEVTDKTFEVPGEICMKVERTYELINWCVYQAGDDGETVANSSDADARMITSEGYAEVGRVKYTQVLKLYVNEAPTITIDEVSTCIVGEGDLAPFGEADDSPGAAPFECDEERTFTASATNCAGVSLASENFTWKFYVDGAETANGTGDSFTQIVTPKTKYKVEFWVSDGCGNSAGDDYEAEFWDCKKPTPYVLNGLAISIMQTGSIQLWASDLDQGSYDNCTSKDKIKENLRIFAGDPTEGPQDLAGVLELGQNITFTCTELGTQSVSLYVIDEEENWDVVGTYVLVQNNMGACDQDPPIDGSATIVGKVSNANGENVELVNVSVNGGDNSMTTGATGAYDFTLTTGGDYTITPEKNVSPLNGVSTYDLVLISKHILGITEFDSPYKYIAADVNKSGSITAFDMVQLRQLILNITSEFPNNTSWRFVDSKHTFASDNPAAENFNEFMSINNLEGNMIDVDFTGVKVGDVNGNAAANSLLGAETRSTNGALSLTATDRFVEAGQTVTVDFTSTDIAATQGYQFTMNFAGLDLVELNEGVAKAANFNTTMAKRGVLVTSWNGEATADEVLFSLTFTANTNGLLSELVSVSSDLTAAEAYNTAGDLMDVKLDFNSSAVSAAFELNQNTPNPFNGETVIGFNLPQAGTATLKVMDVQGKVLTVISQEGNKGYNQVTLNAKTLGATGVLYYQLESSDNIATKKMIIIE